MTFSTFKQHVQDKVFQELFEDVFNQEQYEDEVHDIIHNELNREISYLSLKEIDEIIAEYGLSKAISEEMDSFGCLNCSEEYDSYSPSILYTITKNNLDLTWDKYWDFKCFKENHCDLCDQSECGSDCENYEEPETVSGQQIIDEFKRVIALVETDQLTEEQMDRITNELKKFGKNDLKKFEKKIETEKPKI